jgi:uncharacterized protein YaiL (DUF2058 family)
MGSFRDQLKKANLISKKDEKRLAHEERVTRKEVGREELERQAAARRDELGRLRDAEREKTRELQAELDRDRTARAELAACRELLEREARAPARGGGMRWFFELPDGTMPFLSLTETDRLQLAGGQLCVVRIGPPNAHVYGLLPTPLTKRVHAALPERVAWAARGVLER